MQTMRTYRKEGPQYVLALEPSLDRLAFKCLVPQCQYDAGCVRFACTRHKPRVAYVTPHTFDWRYALPFEDVMHLKRDIERSMHQIHH
jgi:hypothetical protein